MTSRARTRPCGETDHGDALREIKTAQGALEKAGQITLEGHLRARVATAAQRGDTEAIVEELMDALRYR